MEVDELKARCREAPHVYLVLPRSDVPQGRTVNLLGRGGGAKGEICNVKETADGYDVVAVFKSAEVLKMIEEREG